MIKIIKFNGPEQIPANVKYTYYGKNYYQIIEISNGESLLYDEDQKGNRRIKIKGNMVIQ